MSSVDINDVELGAQEDAVVLEDVPKVGRVPLELWSLCPVSSVDLDGLELGATGRRVGALEGVPNMGRVPRELAGHCALCLLALRKMLLFWEAFQTWDEILQSYSLSALCLPLIWTILSLAPWKSCCGSVHCVFR
jgi:hypothetical protein